MEPIRISLSLSPHIVHGVPRGYYVIAKRIFPGEMPILVRQQFVGFSDCLIVTACHPAECDSVLKMAIHCPSVGGKGVTWLGETHLYVMPMGFRAYLPRTILGPRSAQSRLVETTGIVQLSGQIFYVSIPLVNADVLLERKELDERP